jgi:hypothetical protein
MELKPFEYKTIYGDIIELERNEIPYLNFEYRINDELVAKGTKRNIAKKLGLTNIDLNNRLYNTRKGRSKVKHELILIEKDEFNG